MQADQVVEEEINHEEFDDEVYVCYMFSFIYLCYVFKFIVQCIVTIIIE